MSYQEFTGKNVKDAIARACQELDVDENLLDIDVIEESTRGFLGIVGQRDARIRVRRRDALKEVMQAEAPKAPAPKAAAPKAAAPKAVAPVSPAPVPQPEPVSATEDLAEEEVADEEVVEAPVRPEERPSFKVDADSPYVEKARVVLEEILRLIPVDATVVASISEGAVYLDIKGDGSGLMIGKKGQTLDALQYLVNKVINKNNPPGHKVEVIVDTENYRVRKTETLREMAVKMSQKAKKTLKPVSLNPMPPHERRIIHLILAEDREVYTKSYGEGPLRRIIIYPRKAAPNKRRRR
jgi:spoIIIJ-associated protein